MAAGGGLTLVGAPQGSVTVEGWRKNEIEVTAEIEWQAATEADLQLISQINNFKIQDELSNVDVLTFGTHDKEYMKKAKKKFPKHLLNLPWKIDYKIRVPLYCDLDLNIGEGTFSLKGVEGAILVKAVKGNADLDLVGGMLGATFGEGNIKVKFNSRSWRGKGIDIQLATGEVRVDMMETFNADLDFTVLREGKITTDFSTLKPRDRTKFSEKSMIARAGNGGAWLKFSVGAGNLFLTKRDFDK